MPSPASSPGSHAMCHPERNVVKSKDLAGSSVTLSSGDTPQRPERKCETVYEERRMEKCKT